MLKHKPSLIAALAMSTRDFFSDADKEPFHPISDYPIRMSDYQMID